METATTSLEEDPASPISENTELSGCLEDTSTPPEADQGSDEFKDSDCGEPLVGQRLVLDFTPTQEDTDYIQRKCCAFWEFVNQQAELEDLGDLNDSEMSEEVSQSGDCVSTRQQPQSTPDLKSVQKTAVSVLELVEEKGLIDGAFESRLPTSHYSTGPTNYEDEKSKHTVKGDRNMEPSKLSICRHRGSPHAASSPSVRAMCLQLQDWDDDHPKCMEPPGPAPDLWSDVTQPPAVKLDKQCTCSTVCRVRKQTH